MRLVCGEPSLLSIILEMIYWIAKMLLFEK